MPLRKIAVSGSKSSGKSILFQAIIDELSNNDLPFRGFKTSFVESGILWFDWINMEHEKIEMGQKTGKRSMKPFLDNLDRIGEILLKTKGNFSIFVADEIGFLEQFSKAMQRGIFKAISDAPFSFFTIKKDEYPFLKRLREIEGLKICDLDGKDWQQKKEIKRMLSGSFFNKNYSGNP